MEFSLNEMFPVSIINIAMVLSRDDNIATKFVRVEMSRIIAFKGSIV